MIYLALHPHGVDRDKLMTDLWPEGSAIQPATIRRAIAEARAWAGHDTTTDPPAEFIPAISPPAATATASPATSPTGTCSADSANAPKPAPPPDSMTAAVADYTAALALVRGPVLHPLRSRGYAWLHDPDQRHADLIPGYVIDTAHELIDLILSHRPRHPRPRRRPRRRRPRPPRRPRPHLRPPLHRPHAHRPRRRRPRRNAHPRRLLLAERDFEVGEDLPPESFAIFNQLFPTASAPAPHDHHHRGRRAARRRQPPRPRRASPNSPPATAPNIRDGSRPSSLCSP